MKKLLATLLMILLMVNSACATILPAEGIDVGFLAFSGMQCTPAVVLCETLSVLDKRGDQGGKKVATLNFGQRVPVIESWDGYAKISYLDGSKTGWVHNEYLLMDPAWYVCDADTQVYAYPETMAPRVAYLDKGTKLPIIMEYADDRSVNGWACVSLRGAAGWIRKTPKDTVGNTWFRPEKLANIAGAVLQMGDNAVGTTDRGTLDQLSLLLTNVEDNGGPMAGCPFFATLTLMLSDGEKVDLLVATDSCCVYRVDNRDYSYARNLFDPYEGAPDNSVLFSLFGLNVQDMWAGQ